jgi:hypothetical protein
MIDDFKIDTDPDYFYDDYGYNKCINASYISPFVQRFGARSFLPSSPGAAEIGARRGSIVLLGKGLSGTCSFTTLREIKL